jgi:hypothetical protein
MFERKADAVAWEQDQRRKLRLGAEGAVVTIELVTGRPRRGRASRHRADDHVQGKLGLGRKSHAGRNASGRAPLLVIGA